MEIIYYHKTLIKYIISRMIFLSLFGGPILTCSTSLFLKGDLRYKHVVLFILRIEFIIRLHIRIARALLEAVPWVRSFFSEFSVYSVVV